MKSSSPLGVLLSRVIFLASVSVKFWKFRTPTMAKVKFLTFISERSPLDGYDATSAQPNKYSWGNPLPTKGGYGNVNMAYLIFISWASGIVGLVISLWVQWITGSAHLCDLKHFALSDHSLLRFFFSPKITWSLLIWVKLPTLSVFLHLGSPHQVLLLDAED